MRCEAEPNNLGRECTSGLEPCQQTRPESIILEVKVTVKFFGPERRPPRTLTLPDGATLADLRKMLGVNGVRFAIGTEYATGNPRLRDGDVVSVIPPVGGG